MDALVSGQAGIALLIQGNDVSAIEAGPDGKEYSSSFGAVPYILDGATDVISLRSTQKNDVLNCLRNAWASDQALQMILILLDRSESLENRRAAAASASELTSNKPVLDFVGNRLYSAPLPPESDISSSMIIAEKLAIGPFLSELKSDQPLVERASNSWERLPIALFESERARQEFRKTMIECGAFRQVAKASSDAATFGMATIQCHYDLSAFPNHRQILRAWLAPLKPSRSLTAIQFDTDTRERNEDRWHGPPRQIKVSGHELFENVQKQKSAITESIRKGDIGRVRSYVEQLVSSQLESSGPEYASKSLCALSQQAKDVHNYSLQLELAQRATEVAPEDGWAHGQVADAYVCLGQFDNALNAFKLSETFGEQAFAFLGRARVLRMKGHLDEALSAFDEATRGYPDDRMAWLGRAEVLRDMWRLDDALLAYDATVEKFPFEAVARCGRAAVLKDMGRLEDSLERYEETIREFGDQPVPLCGKADILKELGKLDESLRVYSQAIKEFPSEPVPRCGYAEVLKVVGRVEEALDAYSTAVEMFPYEAVPYSGRAETLKAMERYEESLQSYTEALSRFPYETRLWSGKADLLKRLGRFRDALRAYDEIIRSFPYDIVALSGRADLLKQLGELTEAVKAYEVLINQYPNRQNFKNAKAAVLGALGKYEEALALLPVADANTRDEWIGQHIRGTIAMRRGRLDLAVQVFEAGINKVPFALERNYFQNGLAVAQLRQRKFANAIVHLQKSREPLSTVLRMHALGGLARIEEAKSALVEADTNCPRNLIPLKNELAAHYRLTRTSRRHNARWIFDQECRNLLLEAA